MNETEAWKIFAATGSIQDYLIYATVKNSTAETESKDDENNNGRTDNQTTEYR